MFIQTQLTPNPNTVKFFPGKILTHDVVYEFLDPEQARIQCPLAYKIFAIKGITNIMIATDYIAISKNDDFEWVNLKPFIVTTIIDYFLHHEKLEIQNSSTLSQEVEEIKEFYDPKDEPVVTAIKELIETHIKNAVARDGGDIRFCGYDKGVVYLSLHGACQGCPSASATLKQGVENLLKHFIPQIQEVRAIE